MQTTTVPDYFTPRSQVMKKIYRKVGKLANYGKPILLVGRSGVGKEFLAWHYYTALIKSRVFNEAAGKAEERLERIRKSREKCKPGTPRYKELSRFRQEIQIGKMHAENCAVFTEDVARSELFGHLKGAFTGADESKPGLLELLSGSLLFLDEVGDLDNQVQIMLNRCLAPPHQGSRMGSSVKYPTDLVFIIAATELVTEDNLRDAFRARLGSRIEIPDLNDREADLSDALRFFLKQEFQRLLEDQQVRGMVLSGNRKDNGSEPKVLLNRFVDELAPHLDKKVRERSWNDNFRSLKTTIENAALLAEDFSSRKNYMHNIVQEFDAEMLTCSTPKNGKSPALPRGKEYSAYPSEQPGLDEKLTEMITAANINIPYKEKRVIASFLSAHSRAEFEREQFDLYLSKHGGVDSYSKSTSLNRLRELRNAGIIDKTGVGKTTRYRLRADIPGFDRHVPKRSFLSLPFDHVEHGNRIKEVEETARLAEKSDCLFVHGAPGVGKSSFVITVGKRLRRHETVYWYPMGRLGMHRFFRTMVEDLQFHRHIAPRDYNASSHHDLYELIDRNRNKLFELDKRPFLILDNAQVLKEYENKEWLIRILSEWRDIRFILTGNQLDSDIEPKTGRHFHQKSLSPYRRS